MAIGPMVVTLALRDTLSAALRTANATVGSVARNMGTAFRGVTSQVFSLQSAIVGIATGATMRSLLNSFVDAEKRTFLFEQTLRNTGRYTPEFAAEMQRLATAMQQVGTVSDEAVMETAQFLALSGRMATSEIPRATMAVADLAAATGGDMVGAARTLLNAIENDGAGLGRLKLGLDETQFAGKSVAEMLTVLEGKFAGMDEKLGRTTAGGIARAANAFDDLREKLGAFVAEVLNSGPLRFLQVFFEELGRDIADLNDTFAKSGDAKKWGEIVIVAMEQVALGIALVIDGLRLIGKTFFSVMSGLGIETPLERARGRVRALNDELNVMVNKLNADPWAGEDKWKPVQELTVKIEAAENAVVRLEDIMGVGAGEMKSAFLVVSEAIDGARARVAALADASADAAKKTLEGAARAAAAAANAGPSQPVDLISQILAYKEATTRLFTGENPAAKYIGQANAELARQQKLWNDVIQVAPQFQAQYEALREQQHAFAAMAAAGVPGMEAQALAMQSWADGLRTLPPAAEAAESALTQAARKAGAAWKKSAADAELEGWEDFFEALQAMANKSATFIADVSKMALEGVSTFIDKFVDGLFDGTIRNMRDVQRIAKEVLRDIAKEATKAAMKALVGAAIQGAGTAILGARGGLWESGNGFAPLPQYAAGGIAREPALIAGEAGAEAIVPLPGAGRSLPVTFTNEGAMGGTVNVAVSIQALDGADVQSVLMSDAGQAALELGIVSRAARSLRFRNTMGGR